MVPINGRSSLTRNIEWLREYGVKDLVINLHYLPEVVVAEFGDGTAHGVRIRYSHEPELRGTAGAVREAWGLLGNDRFLVIYADNLIRLDLRRMFAVHRGEHATMTMALFWRKDAETSGVARIDGNRMVDFVEKPMRPGAGLVNAGVLLCEPDVASFIPGGFPSDFGRDVIPKLLSSGRRIGAYVMDQRDSLHWIDTPADLAATQAVVLD